MATNWRSSYFRYRELFLNVTALYKKRADLQAFLEIVLSIIAVMVFSIFALKPTAITIIDLVKQIREEEKTITLLNTKISNLQKAKIVFSQNQDSLKKVDVAISLYPNPETFALQLRGLSAKNGVELVGITIKDLILVGESKNTKSQDEHSPLPENAKEMEYSINIRGNYNGIASFIKELENMRMISVIDSVTISTSTTDNGKTIVAIISGRVPYLERAK